MIREMDNAAVRLAVVGTERSDAPFPFTAYVAIASARDHLGPVIVLAPHLPYGVWWDRLRPTIELIRTGHVMCDTLPLNGIWCNNARFLAADEEGYADASAVYRTGDGLF